MKLGARKEAMEISIQFNVSDKLFLRDPLETELGKRIVAHSIVMIERMGFEEFTFKKLATEISSTEASVYRYFENKHALLVYLLNWYWAWLEYRIEFALNNITVPKERLEKVLSEIAESDKEDLTVVHVDETKLYNIVIRESAKAFLTHKVDRENKDGFFRNYKSLCEKIGDVILEVNPKYKFSRTLASTLLESAHQQLFYSQHLPRLSDIGDGKKQTVSDWLLHLCECTLKH